MESSTIILFVATSSNSNSGGGRTRIVDVAREVKRRNFVSHILCFVYATQMLSGPLVLAHGRRRLQEEAGCPVYYAPMLPFGRFALIEWINNRFCGLILVLISWRLNADILYGHGFQAGYMGLFARKIHPHLKVISDIQGVVVDEYLYERGTLDPDNFSQMMASNELKTLVNSDHVIMVSRAMQSHYETKLNRPLKNTTLIPCATRAEFHPNPVRRSILRKEYGLADKFVFCYVGSAESYQLPAVMCHLFKLLQCHIENSFFLIFSHQSELFNSFLRKEDISSSSYQISAVPHDQIFDRLQMGDIGMLLRDASVVNRVASPLKFAEYCLCGLPVLTTQYVGDYSEYVQDFSLGYQIETSNLRIDTNLLAFCKNVYERREEYSARCTNFAHQHLSWDVYGKLLENTLIGLKQA